MGLGDDVHRRVNQMVIGDRFENSAASQHLARNRKHPWLLLFNDIKIRAQSHVPETRGNT